MNRQRKPKYTRNGFGRTRIKQYKCHIRCYYVISIRGKVDDVKYARGDGARRYAPSLERQCNRNASPHTATVTPNIQLTSEVRSDSLDGDSLQLFYPRLNTGRFVAAKCTPVRPTKWPSQADLAFQSKCYTYTLATWLYIYHSPYT